MPNKKISQLDPLLVLSGEEFVPVLHNGANYKVSLNDIASLGGGGGGGGPAGPTNVISQLNSSATVADIGADSKFEVVLDDKVKLSLNKNTFDVRNTDIDTSTWIANFFSDSVVATDMSGLSIASDSLGNMVVVGGEGNDGIGIIVKLNPLGEVLWQKSYTQGANWLFGDAVAVDSADNIYFSVYTSAGHALIKLLPDGTLVWQTYLSDVAHKLIIVGLAINSAGDIICSGKYDSSGSSYVAKVSASGNKVWSTILGITGYDNVIDSATDAENNTYVVGIRSDYSASPSINCGFAVKVDPLGNVLWQKLLVPQAGTADTSTAMGVVVLGSNLYVGGSSIQGSTDKPVLYKLSSTDSTIVWTKSFNLPNNARIQSVAIDPITETIFSLSTYYTGIVAGEDMLLAANNSAGDLLWATQVGSLKRDGISYNYGQRGLSYKAGYLTFTGYTYPIGTNGRFLIGRIKSDGLTLGAYSVYNLVPITGTLNTLVSTTADVGFVTSADSSVPTASDLVETSSTYVINTHYSFNPTNVLIDELNVVNLIANKVDVAILIADEIKSPLIKLDPVNFRIGLYNLDLSTGYSNTAFGADVLTANLTGGYNSAFGKGSLRSNVSGERNSAFGFNSLGSNTVGTGNVGLGYASLSSNTSGSENISVGSFSMDYNTTGYNNVAMGNNVLFGNSTGARNTAIGHYAGYNNNGDNNTCIGFNSSPSSNVVSNQITLGDNTISSLRCQVTAITSLSDRRDKKDIQPLLFGLDFVNTLKPVSFTWNTRDGAKVGIKSSGFISQDLKEAQDAVNAKETLNLVMEDNPDKLEATYGHLIPVLVKAIQDISDKFDAQKAEFDAYKLSHP